MTDITEAIRSLRPTSSFGVRGSDIVWNDPDNEQPTDEEIDAEMKKLQAEEDALEYARERQREYPDWRTQLNKIYDDGIDKWKTEMVDPVKTKWPKDNSGPK